MTLAGIFETFTAGSQGFCIAVETHCGFGISRTEIARIAAIAAEDGPNRDDMAARFEWVFQNTSGWADDEQPPRIKLTREWGFGGQTV